MSKPKYALKTTQIIYAVWLEIDAVWLGIYGVSVSHFFGGGFSRWTHELCVLHAAKGSSTPVELTESHSTQNIKICWNHPKSKNFRLIKKAPFEGWALQKLTFPHFSTKHDYCCLGCSRYVKPSSRRSPVHVSPTSCSKVLRRRLFFYISKCKSSSQQFCALFANNFPRSSRGTAETETYPSATPGATLPKKTQGFAPESGFTCEFTRFRTVTLPNDLIMGG